MTYAQYAHRGAYPLLVTALLAGAVALVARPFTDGDRMLRAALLFWVGQTALLVISSLLRLELYIEVYGLTRLRLSAAIWMALVASGLGMVMWQIIARRSAVWLLARVAVLGIATLYACTFVSFDRAIADYNLTHDVQYDRWYICLLGSGALPALARYRLIEGHKYCGETVGPPKPVYSGDWREWGFRDWRVLRSLSKIEAKGAPI